MKIKGLLLFAEAAFAWSVLAAGPVFEINFGDATRQETHAAVGTFSGVLPSGVNDNFSAWSPARVTTRAMNADGRSFLRFETATSDVGGQFSVSCPGVTFPGRYRLVVTAQTQGEPLALGFRLHGAPYSNYWSGEFESAKWTEQSFLIFVPTKAEGVFGFYFYPSFGVTDIASIRIFPAEKEDFTTRIRRPDAGVHQFFRHTRFPLGLPAGWNVGRDAVDGTCTADTAEPASDGVPVLKLDGRGAFVVYSEPFQTNEPNKPHTLVFDCRAVGAWSVGVLSDLRPWGRTEKIAESATWRTFRCVFTPENEAAGFCLKFAGNGVLRMDRLRVFAGTNEPPCAADRSCSVSLAVGPGEIAEETRIQFSDEPIAVRWFVTDAPDGACLRTRVTDLYGRSDETIRFAPVMISQKFQKGMFTCVPFSERVRGSFRVEAWLEVNGQCVSAREELVLTRLERPVYWHRDAPDSPFGCHMIAKESTILALKACGVNWTRLHDAGTEYSGWAHLEKKKGVWTFEDAAVNRFRRNGIKIFAQIGTAPTWATHYGDLGYRKMGYFERYLRPTNTVDFLNYVTNLVTRYNGVIDSYFVWNEPWGRWWASAADSVYYDSAKAGYDFGILQKQVYAAVKSVNPAILLAGYNTTSGRTGEIWTRDVEKADVFGSSDILDYHFYTPRTRCGRPDEARTSDAPFAPLRERHPKLAGKPVFMSEGQGTSTGSSGVCSPMSGLYLHSVPFAPESSTRMVRLADNTCRYIVSILSEGVSKVFLYSAHAYTALLYKPSFMVLLGADGYAHPALVAHAHLARMIEDRKFVRKVALTHGCGLMYEFTGKNGTCTVYANLTGDEILALAARKDVRVTDLFGNRPTPETVLPGTLVYAE